MQTPSGSESDEPETASEITARLEALSASLAHASEEMKAIVKIIRRSTGLPADPEAEPAADP